MKIVQMHHTDYRILEFARRMSKELNSKEFNINLNPFHFLSVSVDNIHDKNCGYFVAIDNDDIVGILSCHIVENMASSDKMASEDFFGVLSSASKLTGFYLIRNCIRWAKLNDCKHFMIGANLMYKRYNTAKKVYSKLKFKEYETIYIKEI